MRLALVAVLVAACAPKVAPKPVSYDEELPKQEAAAARPAPAAVADDKRPEAPKGKGLREGTIARAKLLAVLDAGPGMFLRQLEVAPRLDGNRFVGWQLVQLIDHQSPLVDVDVVPGDVLLAINGNPLARPDQLQTVWDSLRTAHEITAQMWRGNDKLELHFTISE